MDPLSVALPAMRSPGHSVLVLYSEMEVKIEYAKDPDIMERY